MMNCAIFIVYKKTLFGRPLTSNNAKTRNSLNEETFANAKLSSFFFTLRRSVIHSFLICMRQPLKQKGLRIMKLSRFIKNNLREYFRN